MSGEGTRGVVVLLASRTYMGHHFYHYGAKAQRLAWWYSGGDGGISTVSGATIKSREQCVRSRSRVDGALLLLLCRR